MARPWRWYCTEREIAAIDGLVSTNPDEASNPVYIDSKGQYYFWDETSTSLAGPFMTKSEVFAALVDYCKTI